MSQVPDIDYSPGINRLKISGCRCRDAEYLPTIRPRIAFSRQGEPHMWRRKHLAILANQLTINKLRWFSGPLSHPSIGRAVKAFIVLPLPPAGCLNP